ncbi:YdcF family protein, partial [Candidatus Saccharibacteria bacterium]|nr:YdcF family protein [Candidatus Saccharibacteria bacterium]
KVNILTELYKILRLLRNTLIVCLFFWMIGFIMFVVSIPKPSQVTDMTKTDAIIVLTGGSNRIEEGLKLLGEDLADNMLISGVGNHVTLKDILKKVSNGQLKERLSQKKIILGHIADSTNSNVVEAEMFMKLPNLESLRLVTSNYHMVRSNMIFKYHMPNYTIIKHPIGNDDLGLLSGKFKLIFNEYNKLVAQILIWTAETAGDYFDRITNLVSSQVYRTFRPTHAD